MAELFLLHSDLLLRPLSTNDYSVNHINFHSNYMQVNSVLGTGDPEIQIRYIWLLTSLNHISVNSFIQF